MCVEVFPFRTNGKSFSFNLHFAMTFCGVGWCWQVHEALYCCNLLWMSCTETKGVCFLKQPSRTLSFCELIYIWIWIWSRNNSWSQKYEIILNSIEIGKWEHYVSRGITFCLMSFLSSWRLSLCKGKLCYSCSTSQCCFSTGYGACNDIAVYFLMWKITE